MNAKVTDTSSFKPLIVLLTCLACQPFVAHAKQNSTIDDFTEPKVVADAQSATLDELVTDYVEDPLELGVCHGYYVRPEFSPLLVESGEHAITADKGELALAGWSSLTGNTMIEDGENRIYSDVLHLHRDDKTQEYDKANAYGRVLIEQPQTRLTGKTANVNLLYKNFKIQDSQFRLYDSHIRGQAEMITQVQNKPYYIYSSRYTTCAPGSNVWEVSANKVILNRASGYGHAYNAIVYIKDIPVFYTPYMFFPIDKSRKSGFLSPSYLHSDKSGNEFFLPYYFNLAPNYDDTLTIRQMSKRGTLFKNEFRYLTSSGEGSMFVNFIPEDRAYASFKKYARTNPRGYAVSDPRLKAVNDSGDSRFHLSTRLSHTYNENFNFEGIFNYVSDDNYFEDLDEDPSFGSNRQLQRTLTLNFATLHTTTSIFLDDYQILQPFYSSLYDEPYQSLPRINSSISYPFFYDGFSTDFNINYIFYRHRRNISNNFQPTTGYRLDLAPSLSYSYALPFLEITPRVTVHKTIYDLDLDTQAKALAQPSKPTRTVPVFSLDNKLFFEREFNWLDQDTIQTFEPRMLYVYVPYVNQNSLPKFAAGIDPITEADLFRESRFAGVDRIANENRLSLGATSRFLIDETGEEKASITAGQMYFFEDQKVSVCNSTLDPSCLARENEQYDRRSSKIFLNSSYSFDKNWNTSLSAHWDPELDTIRDYSVSMSYHPDTKKAANVSYSSSKDNNYRNYTQVTSSLAWQLTPRWNILGQLNYNFADNALIHAFAGVEYENCCWAFRVGKQRYLLANSGDSQQYEDILFFQFVLKGLYSYGESHEDIAEKVIPGYVESFGKRY